MIVQSELTKALAMGLLTLLSSAVSLVPQMASAQSSGNTFSYNDFLQLGLPEMSVEQVEHQCAKNKADLANLWDQVGRLDHDIRATRNRIEKEAAKIATSVSGFGEFYSHYLLESRTLQAHELAQHVRNLPANSVVVVKQTLESMKSQAESLVYSKGQRTQTPSKMRCSLEPKSFEKSLKFANRNMGFAAHHYLLSTRYINQALGLPTGMGAVEAPMTCLNALNSALSVVKESATPGDLADLFIQKWVVEELKKAEGPFGEVVRGSSVLGMETQCPRFVSCHKYSSVVAETMQALGALKKDREELDRMLLVNDVLDKRLVKIHNDIETMSEFVRHKIRKSKNPTRVSTCVNDIQVRY